MPPPPSPAVYSFRRRTWCGCENLYEASVISFLISLCQNVSASSQLRANILLARSYYAELLRAGVQIYEYTPGFIHAKMFTSDDEKAVVGTINLDFRSLYLHFECASYFFRNAVVMDVEEDFQKTLAKSERITLENCRKYPFIRRFAGKALRILAPLM